jgi:hypothetical protein
VLLAALVAAYLVGQAFDLWRAGGSATPDLAGGCAEISAAFNQQRSDVVVECAGRVTRILPDDRSGSRHQRFIVEVGEGHTVLISHNIDLAPRIDELERGDTVAFRGEYEFNDRGGVVHWTHHDPQGRRPGGWLEHDGQRYR